MRLLVLSNHPVLRTPLQWRGTGCVPSRSKVPLCGGVARDRAPRDVSRGWPGQGGHCTGGGHSGAAVFANEKVGQNRSSFFIKNCLHLFREQYNICPALWGCSSAGLERLPVTQKVAGSSPVNPASITPPCAVFFIAHAE